MCAATADILASYLFFERINVTLKCYEYISGFFVATRIDLLFYLLIVGCCRA